MKCFIDVENIFNNNLYLKGWNIEAIKEEVCEQFPSTKLSGFLLTQF